VARRSGEKGDKRPTPSIADALREWVERTPSAPAVEGPRGSLTYGELWARAEAAAGSLRRAGLGRGGIAALRVSNPGARIVGMVGTLLAGGAYLALDDDLPGERLEFLLADSRPQVVVTEESLLAGAASTIRPGPDDLACVFYTSGTTGRPKGVPLRHRGVTRLFGGDEPMRLEPGMRMSHFSNVMFDATTLEVWGPLLQGGTVVCLPRHALLELPTLAVLIAERRLDAMFVTTALFREIAAREPAAFARLDALWVGGEALDAKSAAAVLEAGAPRRFYNLYGPTETTTLASYFDLRSCELRGPAVPIGRPVPHTSVYVLDPELRPVPRGELGEIFVGGDGLGPGYLGRPDLTAERFLPDPFAARPGARMYRTGDLARVLPDGALVFSGRRDRQVKVSGFRIELEELETLVAEHPEVGGCVVEVEEDGDRRRSLVAFVACPPALTEERLRSWLAERLPQYLVPSRIVRASGLPLTPNGKVDRARVRAHLDERHDEPRAGGGTDGLEAAVADAWASVLGVPVVERSRNFFDVGGTSLLLLTLQAELQARLGRAPEVRELLRHTTVEAQARLLAGEGEEPVAGKDELPDALNARARLRRRRALAGDVRG
jgi:amino acid adenylation domain-containing protein